MAAPFWVSVQVMGMAAIAIAILGLGLGIGLARVRFPGQILVSTVLCLPLVLPPSVVGYGLLWGLGRGSWLRDGWGVDVVFTPQGAAIAATVVALPLMVESCRAAIAGVDRALEDAARVQGATEWGVLRWITVPLASRGILAGFSLALARGLGEFGATLMVAGNIPGRTQTLPLALYNAVLLQEYDTANRLALVLGAIAFAILWWVRYLERGR